MISKYKQFIFEYYRFDAADKTLELHYGYDGTLHFTETYRFDFGYAHYDSEVLDRTCQNLFFMAGVSYYKAYLAPKITVNKGLLDTDGAAFFSKTYQKGLGEFFFVNKLDPNTTVEFPANTDKVRPLGKPVSAGLLVGIGGGKDSLTSVELLRGKVDDLSTWSANHRPQLTPQVERIRLPHYWVERTIDPSLIEHNANGALNGHVPISAILACVGTVVGVLAGKRDVVVSNEQSANEPTLRYKGVSINHQYSKSQEFEADFQAHLDRTLGDSIRYYSILRPLSELRIAELFAKIGFDEYQDVFSSCNRAFTLTQHRLFWDGTCPKCAFIFLVLTPFLPRKDVETLFKGKNLLLDPNLEITYRQLLGIEGDKPLECVGEIKESRAAMRMAEQYYPELAGRYAFDLPKDYNYATPSSHLMPPEVYALVLRSISAQSHT